MILVMVLQLSVLRISSMPIVDDPFDFGRIAATNAISDIFAMGGKPIMAIAILGFPINKLPAEVAQKIVDGGRFVCHQAGISLLAVTRLMRQNPFWFSRNGCYCNGSCKT